MKPRIPQRISVKAEGVHAPTGRAKRNPTGLPTQAFNVASGPLLAIAVKRQRQLMGDYVPRALQ